MYILTPPPPFIRCLRWTPHYGRVAEAGKQLGIRNLNEVYENVIERENEEKLLNGNFNLPKSPGVIRRIRSMINERERIHKNVTIELDAIQLLYYDCDTDSEVIKSFLQHRGANSLFTILYSEKQLALLKNIQTVLHFDATGSLLQALGHGRCSIP
jgi:hypothetical protein